MNQAISRSQLLNVLCPHVKLREGKKNKREVAIAVIKKEESDWQLLEDMKKRQRKNHIKFENLESFVYGWVYFYTLTGKFRGKEKDSGNLSIE